MALNLQKAYLFISAGRVDQFPAKPQPQVVFSGLGGLREKTMAAYAAGVTTVLIPDENLSNLDEVDSEVKEKLTFIPCKHARDVLAVALAKGGATTQRTVNDKTETIFIPQKPLNAPVIRGKDNKR